MTQLINKKEEIKKRIEQINNGEIPQGYKKEHGFVVPCDWNILRFKNLFDRIIQKNNIDCNNVLTISAQYGLINQQDFFNKNIASADLSGYYLINKGDFAYNKSYSNGFPYGAIKRLKLYNNGVVSTLYICFRAKKNCCTEYLEQYFDANKFNSEILTIAQEGARNHGLLNMGIDDFFNCRIIHPEIKEQEKIAEVLSCCDKVIKLKQKLLDEKFKQKKWLMNKLFSQNNATSYKLDMLGSTYTGLSGKNKNDFGFGKKFIPYTNIFANVFVDTSSLEMVNIEDDENQNKVQYGDIFFTTSSECPEEVGMASVILDDITDLYLNSFCFGFRLKNFKILLPQYAGYLFRTPSFRLILNKLAQGMTRFNLSKNSLIKEYIKIPKIEIQEKVVNILSQADKEIELLQNELDEQKRLKKSLSQLLLTGIVRVGE